MSTEQSARAGGVLGQIIELDYVALDAAVVECLGEDGGG